MEANVSDFVLVHGSWMGAWAWQRVLPLLEAGGARATAIDLPGYGQDTTPIAEITLGAYTDKVLAAVDAVPGPVLLVGHSMGGIVVSAAAEQRPGKLAAAVYVAAYMLPSGESVFSFSQSTPEFGSSRVMGYLEIDQDAGTSRIKPEGIGPVFVNDGSEEDVEFARAHAQVDFLAPSGTPVTVTEDNWGRVPRTYIETLKDQAVPVAAQRRRNELLPGADVKSLDTGHSPFLTQPQQLAEVLLSIARVSPPSERQT
jgi:pimeloyl-ACP methyl ester carboxylesterase